MTKEKPPETLWKGKHLSIVKYPGCSYYGGSFEGTRYIPMEILWVANTHLGKLRLNDIPTDRRERIWEGGEGRHFSKAVLAELIEKVKVLDAGWADKLAAQAMANIKQAQHDGEVQATRELYQKAEEELLETARGHPTTIELAEAAADYCKAVEALEALGVELFDD